MPITTKLFSKNSSKYNTRNNKKNKLKKNGGDSDSDDDFVIEEDEDEDDDDYETTSEISEEEPLPKKKRGKTNKKSNKKVKKNFIDDLDEDGDEDEDEDIEDTEDEEEEEEDDEDDEEEEVVNRFELQKFLSKMFPSKYMQKKVENSVMEGVEDELQEKKKSKKSAKKASVKKSKKPTKKPKRRVVQDSDEEDEDEDDDEEEDEDEEDEDEEEDGRDKVDIIFYGNDGFYQDPDEYNDEDDDADCDSDDEKAFMKEKYEQVELPSAIAAKSAKKDKKKSKKDKKNTKDENADVTDVEQEYLDLLETKKTLTTQLNKKPKSKILMHAVEECNRSMKKLVKKARIRNAKTYHKLIHDDKQGTNEIDYFKKNLSNKEQLRIMKDLKEVNSFMNIDRPYRLALLEARIPPKFKAIALQKLNALKHMEPGDNEYYKIKNWVDTFMRIPFCNYKSLTVTMDDGLEKCHDFMSNAMKTLDNCVYGLNDAKLQIMQMVGQWISNPSAMGTAIAIKGPMGTGKTTLVKEGISKILGREFAFIALGGAGDSSFLEGHSYTYEGSTWGRIVQIIIESKCMNPVIYFDELDKISDTPRGEEIVGILTHLTDTSQNSQFHDKYFSDIDFDLSKCLFIFSYNDEHKVNPILRDRMYRIQTKGYDAKEKITIARNYILPKIREQVNFKEEDVIVPDDIISYIASSESLTKNEAGVRNLKRCLEIIYTKLNLFRLVKAEANIFAKDIDIKVEFPFTVTKKHVDVFIKNEENQNQSMLAMYC